MEIIVDAYTQEEQAIGWKIYLEETKVETGAFNAQRWGDICIVVYFRLRLSCDA